jgi:hypothetical protein
MMRYLSNNPGSLDPIHQIVIETFSEINIASENLRLFWFESLQNHLESQVQMMDPIVNLVIAKIYLQYGKWFWNRLDFSKSLLFANTQNCSILYKTLFLMKCAATSNTKEKTE